MQALAPCCLFLAAKIEEQPRKLEHVIKVAHACLHRDGPPLDLKSEVCFILSTFHHCILKIQGSWQFFSCSCPGCCKTNLSKDFADCICWTSILSQSFLSCSKLSRVFQYLDRNTEEVFCNSFRKHCRHCINYLCLCVSIKLQLSSTSNLRV